MSGYAMFAWFLIAVLSLIGLWPIGIFALVIAYGQGSFN